MEGECVDGPDVVGVIYRLAVALERVLFLLDGWRGVKVLYGDAAFYGGGRVTWEKDSKLIAS
jgi:hypothetical protein